MSLWLRRKPLGAPPPNTLKKNPSTTARQSTSSRYNENPEQHQHRYQHRPWATAHLFPQNENQVASPIETNTALETKNFGNEIVQTNTHATMPANRSSNTPGKTPHPDETTDLITPLPSSTARHSTSTSTHHLSPYTTSPTTGHSNVSLPARPPRKHTYSECFDLEDFASNGTHTTSNIRSPSGSLLSEIRSPSGNFLSAEQAAARLDRPSGIRERQEAIRRKVREVRERERARVEELGLGNSVVVVGGVQAEQGKGKGKGKGKGRVKGKFASLCGCL